MKTTFGFRALSLTLVVTSAIASIAPSAQPADAPTTADAIAAIQAYAQRALAEHGAPGMSVAITA